MNILITGSRAPVALDFSRRFHRHGHQVFHADSLKHCMGKHSNSVTKVFHVPRPVESPQAYAEALSAIIDEHQIDWLIPTCEEVFFIAAFRSLLNCDVLTDSFEKIADFHNKWTFSQFVGNQFASVPKTILLPLSSESADRDLYSELPAEESLQDWVFKPIYSRFASRTLVGPTTKQLKQLYADDDQWIAQRRIRGTEYSTYSIAHHGKLLAHSAYTSLYRTGQGSGICFQPIHSEQIEAFVREYVEQFDYTGQIGFDLIEDDAQKLWVLEANPRATSGAQLFGCDDPLIEALTLQSEDVIRPSSAKPAMIEFAMPLWGLSDAVRNGKWMRFLPDVLRSRWMTFSLHDPWPTLSLLWSLQEIIAISRQEQVTLQQASTFDIEWNGESM